MIALRYEQETNGRRALPLQGKVRFPRIDSTGCPILAKQGWVFLVHRLAIFSFLLLFSVLLAAAQPPQQASLPIGSAVVGEVKGSVAILSPQGSSIRFERGQLIESGSTIETAKGSIVLNLQDGSQILVRPNSRVVLQSPPESAGQYLQLMLGKIWAKVQKRFANAPSFRMGTPSAVITVRGTEFTVELTKNNETFVYVTEGVVEVAQRGDETHSILVNPGYFTRVRPNHPPEPPRQHIRDNANVINDLRSGRGRDDADDGRPSAITPGRQPGQSGGEEHEGGSQKPPSEPDDW